MSSKADTLFRQTNQRELVTLGLELLRRAKELESEAWTDIVSALFDAAPRPSDVDASSSSEGLRNAASKIASYLSMNELVERIPYKEKTIRNLMSTGELVEGQHFFKRLGRVMFSWPAMRAWVEGHESGAASGIPLVRNRRNGRPS
jgi:hypothetical protein